MTALQVLDISGIFLLSLVIGGMFFFATIMTPLVFTKLPPDISGPFIRKAFPIYSQVMGGLCLLAALALWNHPEALPLAIVFLLFLFGWLILMPRINHHRDEQLAGNKVAISKFNRLHKLSVVLNSLQLTTVSVVFIRLII